MNDAALPLASDFVVNLVSTEDYFNWGLGEIARGHGVSKTGKTRDVDMDVFARVCIFIARPSHMAILPKVRGYFRTGIRYSESST